MLCWVTLYNKYLSEACSDVSKFFGGNFVLKKMSDSIGKIEQVDAEGSEVL